MEPVKEVRPTFMIRMTNLLAVVIPFVGLILAIVFLWGRGFSWIELSLLVGMYILTALGITVGYHRLFTHRSFQTFKPIQYILAVLGGMAVEGPLLRWVATHRRHHQHSDQPDDPHSPNVHGEGFLAMIAGLWHAHVGWVFKADLPGMSRYVADLSADKVLRRISALFPLWLALGLLIPTVLGGLLTMTWMGALFGFIWGGLARIFLVHHVTWSVNSICHIWGTRPFATHDQSRNNPVVGILAMGEGWHNAHHAFPNSARHGLRWWEPDISYGVIHAMSKLGLAWKVKIPTPEAMAAKSRKRRPE